MHFAGSAQKVVSGQHVDVTHRTLCVGYAVGDSLMSAASGGTSLAIHAKRETDGGALPL